MGANAQRRAASRQARRRPLGLHPGYGQTWPGYGALEATGERLRETWDLAQAALAEQERERRALLVSTGNMPMTGAARRRAKALRNAGQLPAEPRIRAADVDFVLRTFPDAG